MSDLKRRRLKKYTREKPENLPNRRITPRSIAIIDVINRYRLIPTSMIVRLIAGDVRTTQRHLQNLYHRGLINRFAFPMTYHPSEFNYYLDAKPALNLLRDSGYVVDDHDFEVVRNNREKRYSEITVGKELVKFQGRLMHLHHELMISRFHYMLEKASLDSGGKVELLGFYQGSRLWNEIEVAKVTCNSYGEVKVSIETETLPHRPDAFFGLFFPDRTGGNQTSYFFYEADRKTTSIRKMQRKLRTHFHYVVKQKRNASDYGVDRIRAVLIESTDARWTDNLRIGARHPIVSGSKPSTLFWFTASDKVFEKHKTRNINGVAREVPRYLDQPDVVLSKIWATSEQDEDSEFLSLNE